MNKIIIITIFLAVLIFSISPKTTHASWWNPSLWFQRYTAISKPNNPVPVLTQENATSSKIKKELLSKNKNNITIKFGQTIELFGVKAKVTDVIEDSRCAQGTQCVWAGTVRIKVLASYGTISKAVILTLGESYVAQGHSITLTSVAPEKIAGVKINPQDYVFNFTLGVVTVESNKKPVDLTILRVQGELYKQNKINYAGFCQSEFVLKAKESFEKNSNDLICNDSITNWAVSVPVSEGFTCEDSTGSLRKVSSGLSQGQTVCLSN
jgi:hypothetical protein